MSFSIRNEVIIIAANDWRKAKEPEWGNWLILGLSMEYFLVLNNHILHVVLRTLLPSANKIDAFSDLH